MKSTDTNKGKIDEVIHKYIGKQSSYGRCSTDWREAQKRNQRKPRNETGTHCATQKN